jgi:PBP1b-binding outer membrane lipoprotein LpoB
MTKILSIAIVATLLCGCSHPLTPAQHAAIDRVECMVNALEPLALQDAELVAKTLSDGTKAFEDVPALSAAASNTVAQVKGDLAMCRLQFPVVVVTPSAADAGPVAL